MPHTPPPTSDIQPTQPKVCLVTGCAGFVGSHLTEALLALGHSVIGVDNFFSGRPENMSAFIHSDKFRFVERSIAEPGLWEDIFERRGAVQTVFHLAAIVSVPYSMTHAEETLEINYRATERLLQAATEYAVDRFAFAGSAAEYGAEERMPVREEYADDETVQLSPYGRAKYLSSRAVGASPLGVSLRFFNIFGPRQDPTSPYSGVISKFMAQTLADEPLTIFGNGVQTRDFVYVHDVVQAYLAAGGLAPDGALPPGIYNVGTGKAVKILALARMVLILTDKPNTILMNIAPRDADSSAKQHSCWLFYPSREGDIQHSVADVAAITATGAWKATTVLSVGLARTIGWYRAEMERQAASSSN